MLENLVRAGQRGPKRRGILSPLDVGSYCFSLRQRGFRVEPPFALPTRATPDHFRGLTKMVSPEIKIQAKSKLNLPNIRGV